MYYIGFDIGGTKCAVSLGKYSDGEIEMIERHETPTKSTPVATLDGLSSYVVEWTKSFDVKRAGVSCGGPLDPENGIIISPPNLAKEWHGFDITGFVKNRFGIDARLENDANASAVAEWKFGAGRGTKNFIFMTFGTGLGAGLILNNRLYSGTNGNAGEIGHIRLADDGPVGYNKVGSAEGFCSGGGILRLAQLRAQEEKISLPDALSTKMIFEKARQGDDFSLSIVKESAEKFGAALSLLIDLFNPEVIVAGGVFMRNYDLFLPIIKPIIERESLADSSRICKILPAQIGESIGDFAALSLAIMEDQE